MLKHFQLRGVVDGAEEFWALQSSPEFPEELQRGLRRWQAKRRPALKG